MKRTAFKKKPSWSYCTADWINEIKIRTSWTNEKLAGELGVSLDLVLICGSKRNRSHLTMLFPGASL